MKRIQLSATFFTLRPRWVVAGVLTTAALFIVLAAFLAWRTTQVPFLGLFTEPTLVVNDVGDQTWSGYAAGLHVPDHLAALDGQPLENTTALMRELARHEPGDVITLTARGKDGTLRDVRVCLEPLPVKALTDFFVLPYVLGLMYLGIGVWVFLARRHEPAGQVFAMLCATTALGLGLLFDVYTTHWFPRVWITALSLSGSVFAHLALVFPQWIRFLNRVPVLRYLVYVPGVFIAVVNQFTVLNLDAPTAYFDTWFVAFAFVSAGVIFFLAMMIYRDRRPESPIVQAQARTILWGSLLAFSPIAAWFIIFRFIEGLFPPMLLLPWLVFFPLSIAFAILRYQLFDIRVVVRKGLVYSLLTATLTTVFLLLSLLTGYLFQGLTGRQSVLIALFPALFIAALFQPARGRIQTFVDRAFFRREYEVRQALTAFSQGLSTLREQGEVVRLVLGTVTETLGAEGAALWLLDDGQYRPTEAGLARAFSVESGLAIWLTRERRSLLLIPDDHSPQAEDLRRAGATLAVPFLASEGLLGILTLGEKRSGELYTQDDLELLTSLAHSATLALENARLHEERMAILRQQLAQVTAAQEEERQRIARELHDGVGPALASLNIRLRTARKLMERDHNLAVEEIEELAELAQANIQDIRRLIYDLRPAALDELGLVPALREYVSRYQVEHGLEVALALPEGGERLPAVLETALFRIVQEALANVAKHAQARRVEVAMTRDEEGVTLRIADDGQGFDPQTPRPGTHVGLWSMGERVGQLGGQFEVESAPGAGTTVRVIIPLRTQGGESHGQD